MGNEALHRADDLGGDLLVGGAGARGRETEPGGGGGGLRDPGRVLVPGALVTLLVVAIKPRSGLVDFPASGYSEGLPASVLLPGW